MRGFFRLIGRLVRLAITLAVLVALLCVGMNLVVTLTTAGDIVSSEKADAFDADCILVLGCSVYADGKTPSPMLKDRLDTAIKLYKEGVAPKILMSGDHSGQYYNEVKVMKNYAIDKGVPSEDIFCDHYGVTTYDSFKRAKDVFVLERVVVVTQKYHLYRGLFDAKWLGIKSVGVASDMRVGGKELMREFFGRLKDFTFCVLGVDAQYAGGEIPVDGNGDITNDREDLPQ